MTYGLIGFLLLLSRASAVGGQGRELTVQPGPYDSDLEPQRQRPELGRSRRDSRVFKKESGLIDSRVTEA